MFIILSGSVVVYMSMKDFNNVDAGVVDVASFRRQLVDIQDALNFVKASL